MIHTLISVLYTLHSIIELYVVSLKQKLPSKSTNFLENHLHRHSDTASARHQNTDKGTFSKQNNWLCINIISWNSSKSEHRLREGGEGGDESAMGKRIGQPSSVKRPGLSKTLVVRLAIERDVDALRGDLVSARAAEAALGPLVVVTALPHRKFLPLGAP